MCHRAIIEELSERIGSQSLLAEQLGVDRTKTTHWKTRGIPPRHWPMLLKLARRHRYPLTLNHIAACSPQRRTANARPVV